MIRSIRVFSDRILNIYHNKAIKHSYYWRLWCNYERLGIFFSRNNCTSTGESWRKIGKKLELLT